MIRNKTVQLYTEWFFYTFFQDIITITFFQNDKTAKQCPKYLFFLYSYDDACKNLIKKMLYTYL